MDLEIIDPQSKETPETIWNAYHSATERQSEWVKAKRRYDDNPGKYPEPGPRQNDAPIPWLRVKDLYAGVTMTGQESWPELVRQQHKASGADQAFLFTVFTGMHGNLGGQFLDDEGKMREDYYKDVGHTAEDKATATKLMQDLHGCDIKVIDVFEQDNLMKPEELRDAVKKESADGRVVILAWCYSMEGFKAVSSKIVKDSQQEIEYVRARSQMKIQDIVADVFGQNLSEYMRKP